MCNRYYLWATVAIWLVQLLGRMFWKTSAFKLTDTWFGGFPTTVHNLGAGMMRMEVLVPHTWSWTPGQHVFLRFPSIGILDHHPFTIASIPSRDMTRDKGDEGYAGDEVNTLSFLIRAQAGFTRRLLKKITAAPDMQLSAVVDGPYGTVHRRLEKVYDNVILVAGGGGVTAILPWALHLVNCIRGQEACITRVHLVWMVRHASAIRWISGELQEALQIAPEGSLKVEVYVTDEEQGSNLVDVAGVRASPKAGDEDLDMDPADKSSRTNSGGSQVDLELDARIQKHFQGRPVLSKAVPEFLGPGRTAIIGCGPESLKVDLSNAVAASQGRVLKGEVAEVMLHTETFGW